MSLHWQIYFTVPSGRVSQAYSTVLLTPLRSSSSQLLISFFLFLSISLIAFILLSSLFESTIHIHNSFVTPVTQQAICFPMFTIGSPDRLTPFCSMWKEKKSATRMENPHSRIIQEKKISFNFRRIFYYDCFGKHVAVLTSILDIFFF